MTLTPDQVTAILQARDLLCAANIPARIQPLAWSERTTIVIETGLDSKDWPRLDEGAEARRGRGEGL